MTYIPIIFMKILQKFIPERKRIFLKGLEYGFKNNIHKLEKEMINI